MTKGEMMVYAGTAFIVLGLVLVVLFIIITIIKKRTIEHNKESIEKEIAIDVREYTSIIDQTTIISDDEEDPEKTILKNPYAIYEE
jgi:uncharacterized membrane protein YgaE (UPF0421/DUF939 family)